MAGRPRVVTARSLQLRLSAWLIAAILAAAALGAVEAYRSAYDDAIELQDHQLRDVAALIAPLERLPVPKRDAFHPAGIDDADQRIAIGRLSGDGRGLPAELQGLPETLGDGYHSRIVHGAEWRIFVSEAAPERVVVAQRTTVRDDVAQDGAYRALVPFIVLIPILLVVVAVIVRRMFAPLRALAAGVDARAEDELGAIPGDGVPSEIQPLVRATNRLLARVEQTMAAQRRFIADAAHELRSPLAVLTLQAERLNSATLPDEARARLAALSDGLKRARALLDQLLTLARMREAAQTDTLTPLGPVLRTLIAAQMPLALRKAIDIGVVGDAELRIPAAEIDLATLLRNLIDNALRYSPDGSRVDIVVERSPPAIEIAVRDEGPGVPRDMRQLVFQPFNRLAGDAEGSGLGLAIVRAIADRYGWDVAIGDGEGGTGTCVTVRIPA